MTKGNAYIRDYLDAYKRSSNVEFALLISGGWGCGKTTFVKNWLQGACPSVDGEVDYVMVSLNGLDSLGAIKERIFELLHPKLAKAVTVGKWVGRAASVFGVGMQVPMGGKVTLSASAKELSKLIPAEIEITKPLMIFDDVERCAVDIECLMGYFDELRTGGVKIILIADEAMLCKRWPGGGSARIGLRSPGYEELKEKIIGRTYVLTEEIDQLYGALIGDKTNSSWHLIWDLLHKNRATYIGIFKSVPGHCNYRAFKHAFRDANYWLGRILPKRKGAVSWKEKESAFARDFLKVFIALDYELQVKSIVKGDLGKFSNGQKDSLRTPYEGFLDRHKIVRPNYGTRDSYLVLPESLMFAMATSEAVDMAELCSAVKNTAYFVVPEKESEWHRLKRWWQLSDDELCEHVQCVRQKLEHGEYRKPEEFLHVLTILGELMELNILDGSAKSFLTMCQSAIRTVVKRGGFDLQIDDNGYDPELIQAHGCGLVYSGELSRKGYYSKPYKLLKDALVRQRDEWIRQQVNDLIAIVEKSPEDLIKRLSNPKDAFLTEPVFKFVSPKKFLVRFLLLNPLEQRKLIETLNSVAFWPQRIKEEQPFWRALQKLVEGKLQASIKKSKRRKSEDFALQYFLSFLSSCTGSNSHIVFPVTEI